MDATTDITIGNIHLADLDDEQLQRLAMDLRNDFRRGAYMGRECVFHHKMRKIRAEWDRRDPA